MSEPMNDRGNITLELAFGLSLFASLLLPLVLEFSNVTEAHRHLHNSLHVLGRAWSMASREDGETTLNSLKASLSSMRAFSMRYSCSPNCLHPEARLTIRLGMNVDSFVLPKLKIEGTFARDYFSR